jgi:hypothetical protein
LFAERGFFSILRQERHHAHSQGIPQPRAHGRFAVV